jgi:hypothetical protein
MRKWINLVESVTAHWPETIDGWDLAQRVAEFHHSPEDFDEGDIEQNISAFGTYHLQQVPLSALKRGLFTIYDDLVTTYAGQTTAAPPVIVDLEHRLVIDGNHRVEAAMKRGEETISAYVGDPSTYEAPDDDDDDDDEWHPDLNEGGEINLVESAPRTLYHGTLKEYLPEIERTGLIPSVGDFVLNFYDPSGDEGYDPEYDSLEPLLFAAGKGDLIRCVNAIRHRLRAAGMQGTCKEVVEHGAIIVIKDGDDQFHHRHPDADFRGLAHDHPRQVEPGDYYSMEEAVPAFVVVGKRLRDLLRRNRIDGFYSAPPPVRAKYA